MASVYSQEMTDAHDFFDLFVAGEFAAGSVASATGAGVITTLSFTPDWVLFEVGVNPNGLSWTATSTTLTLTGRSTTTAATISYICGNLS